MVMITRSWQDRLAWWRTLGIPPPHRPSPTSCLNTPPPPTLPYTNRLTPNPPQSNLLCPFHSKSKCRNESFSNSYCILLSHYLHRLSTEVYDALLMSSQQMFDLVPSSFWLSPGEGEGRAERTLKKSLSTLESF